MKLLVVMPFYNTMGHSSNINTKVFLNELKNRGHEITILSTDNSYLFNLPIIREEDGMKIISLFDKRNLAMKKFQKDAASYSEMSKFFKLKVRVASELNRLFKIKTDEWPIDAISYSKIRENLENKYDAIISTSSPFASHVIASYLKRKKVASKWYAFLWDPYVFNVTFSNSFISRKNASSLAFKNVDQIFSLLGIKEHNEKNNYHPSYETKMMSIVTPSLKEVKVSNTNFKETELLYAGTFYRDIRNPKEMFKVLSLIDLPFTLKLYSKGCEDIVASSKEELKEKLSVNGLIDKDELFKEIEKTTILVNLSNRVSNQLPGKTFELISTGKPIINFYFTEEDMSTNVFNKYPLSFSFNLESYTDKDIEDLKEFIKNNKNAQISFEEATKNLTEFIGENVMDSVIKIIEN